MDAEKFKSTAIALLRSAVGWQSAIARRLDTDPRQVRRALAANKIPDWMAERLNALTGAADNVPWPRDEWVNGEAVNEIGQRREYIVHIQPPRFVARVVALDDDGQPLPEEMPADIVSGTVYMAGDDTALCEIDWIDEVKPGEHVQLLEAACDALDGIADAEA